MKTNAPMALVITAIAIGIITATFVAEYQMKHPKCARIIDRETVSIAERPPLKVYIRTEHQYFPPGSILTSKENEALILWDSTMPETLIVGIVSDSGTIEHYKPE